MAEPFSLLDWMLSDAGFAWFQSIDDSAEAPVQLPPEIEAKMADEVARSGTTAAEVD